MTRHFVVIGAQRCGTTYLATQLEAHPQIAMARPGRPEPKVFLDDAVLSEGKAGYKLRYFGHAGPDQVLGEKSTSYSERPDAIARIRTVLGRPLVVVALRDPVERAFSNWRFSTDNGLEQRPFARAVQAELSGDLPPRPEGVSVSPYAYLARGRYADHLDPWVREFGDDLVVVFMDELIEDENALAGLYERLGTDPRFRPDSFGDRVNASSRESTGPDADTRAILEQHFAAPDERLAGIVGRELPWSYR